jgi:hypothetical protein
LDILANSDTLIETKRGKMRMDTGIERIAANKDVGEQAKTISSLLKTKELHQFSKTPAFQTLVHSLVKVARDVSSVDRLRAIALLCKIAALVKGQRLEVGRLVRESVENPLQPLSELADPDDRYYLATFWRFSRPQWAQHYLAVSAVHEEGSEPVRKECVEGLMSGSDSLSSAIDPITFAMKDLSFKTVTPATSKARRLRRVLAAITSSFVASFKEPGEKIGTSLRNLLRETFEKVGIPQPLKVQEELAEEALALLHEIVRARFVFATSSDTYVSIDTINDWFSAPDWSNFAEQSSASALIARDLEEGIEMLSRAGMPDNTLIRFLSLMTGGEREMRQRLLKILGRNPGLPEELAAWLQGQEIRKKSPLAAESQMAQIDEGLATLLLDSILARDVIDHFKQEVLPKMRVLGSEYEDQVRSLIDRLSAIANAIDALVVNRSLRISGEVGTVVLFSPLQHELTESAHFGTRNVRILRPAIIAQLGDGSSRVVRKALVERANGG